MAWEWSHSPEAYGHARDNLHAESREFLEVAFAEIKGSVKDSHYTYHLNMTLYGRELANAKTLPNDILADAIWEFAEEHRTCDNGGFNARVCPHGCHTVSMDDLGNATE
jgi:hypothetical protein